MPYIGLFQESLWQTFTDRTPVAFQLRNHYLVWNRDYTFKYDCLYNTLGTCEQQTLSKILKASRRHQPKSLMKTSCVLMFLMNLAEPDWFTVPCEQQIVDAIICQYETLGNSAEKTEESTSPKILGNSIFEFIRHRNITITAETAKDVTNHHILDLNFIWDPLLFSNSTFLHILKYYFALWSYYSVYSLTFKILHNMKHSSYCTLFTLKRTSVFESQNWEKHYESCSVKDTTVYLLGHANKYELHINLNYFLCNDGTYIQTIYVCDNNTDCFDGSDEINCFCTSFQFDPFQNYSMTCKYIFFKSYKTI